MVAVLRLSTSIDAPWYVVEVPILWPESCQQDMNVSMA